MEGQAQIGELGLPDCTVTNNRGCNKNGSLAWLAKHQAEEFGFAVTNGGRNWTTRQDVYMWTNEVGSACSSPSMHPRVATPTPH